MYTTIIIDVVNLFYKVYNKVFNKDNTDTFVKSNSIKIDGKAGYKNVIAGFINEVEELKKTYLDKDGVIYLLFDNADSRDDIANSFYHYKRKTLFSEYKAGRKKENCTFYNSINILRYYYILMPSDYKLVRVDHVEADDLVKPLLEANPNRPALMVSNDYDWTRYLTEHVYWLYDLSKPPENAQLFYMRKGFYPTEESIVLYKTLFGDKSDNIPSIIPENDKNTAFFRDYCLVNNKRPKDLIAEANDKRRVAGPYGEIYARINEVEQQVRINEQLIRTIPISVDYLKRRIVTGRDAIKLREQLDFVLGLKEKPAEKFVFGKAKPPRK